MPLKRFLNPQKKQTSDPQALVLQLYQDYCTQVGENLWPWEQARWYEFVFCIMNTVAEPHITVDTARQLTRYLSKLGLLDLNDLARLNRLDSVQKETDALWNTLQTILQKSGLTAELSRRALSVVCKAADHIETNYGGKVQNYFIKYGKHMLAHIKEDFGFEESGEELRAATIWLQNTLNMPVPASNPIADQACEQLGVTYDELVKAANQHDINLALLDDALRVYWESRGNQG